MNKLFIFSSKKSLLDEKAGGAFLHGIIFLCFDMPDSSLASPFLNFE